MPFTQLISPAGIGETLEVGQHVVTNNIIIDVLHPDGLESFDQGTPKYTFVTEGAIEIVTPDLLSTACWITLPLFIPLSPERVTVLSAGSLDLIGQASLKLGEFHITPDSFQGQVGNHGTLSPFLLSKELNFSFCHDGYSAKPFIFEEPRPNTGLMFIDGLSHDQYGNNKVVPVQKLFPGWTDEVLGTGHIVSSLQGFLTLSRTYCGQNSGYKHYPLSGDFSNRILFLNEDQDDIGEAKIRNRHEFISPTGESQTQSSFTYVYGDPISLRIYETFCFVLPSALQHSLGKAKGIQMFGVPPVSPQVGDPTLIQGPPKITTTLYTYTLYGNHTIGVPISQTLVFSGNDQSIIFSTTDVKNFHQFVYTSGDTHTFYNPAAELTLKDQFPTFFGNTLDNIGGIDNVSLYLRYITVPSHDFLGIPTNHFISRSPRYIDLFPNLEIFNEFGTPFIFERIFSAGDQLSIGVPYVFNSRQYMGPIGNGNNNEQVGFPHKVEHGLRYVFIQPDAPFSTYGNLYIRNNNQIITQGGNAFFQQFGEYTRLDNATRPILAFGDILTDIPITHLVQKRPNQMLPVGETYSNIGNHILQHYVRRLYPTGYTYPVFNPGMYVDQEIVIAFAGDDHFHEGNFDSTLLDLPYYFQGEELSEFGSGTFVDYGIRTLGPFYTGNTDEYGLTPSVNLQVMYITPDTFDYSIFGPFTNVIEHFSRIIVSTLDFTDIGGIQTIKNLNKNLTPQTLLPHDSIGDSFVGLFTREILMAPVTGTVGEPSYVGDNTLFIQFIGEDLSKIGGINNMYYGQPNLPVNQIARPHWAPQQANPIGQAIVGHVIQRLYPQYGYGGIYGDDGDYGIPSLQSNGIGPFTLNVTLNLGDFRVVAATNRPLNFTGKDFLKVGIPRFDPSYIYMTTNVIGDPYPGTPVWHKPDNPPPYYDDRYTRQSKPVIQNFIRHIYPGGYPALKFSYPAANVHFPPPDPGTLYINAQGKAHAKYVNPFLSGGQRNLNMEFGNNHQKFGTALVTTPPPPPVTLPITNATGGSQTLAGSHLVDFFHRRIYPSAPPTPNITGSAWLSFSPRDITPTGYDNPVFIGDHMVSFVIRHIFVDGDTFTYARGYSFDAYSQRMKVKEVGLEHRSLYGLSALDQDSIPTPYVGRVAPCA